MFELYMLNQEVSNLENVVVKEFSGQPAAAAAAQTSILNFDTDYLMTYFIMIQNVMFLLVFALMRPTTKSQENIHRWKKKDVMRLDK